MERSSCRGFTLIEVMIVIAIMGIMAAMAMPNYQTLMAKKRLNGAARQVMSSLMSARQRAVNQNNQFKVFFNTDGHSYIILDDRNNNGTADTGELTEFKDLRNDYFDVTFVFSWNPTFYPRGTAFGATVSLTSAKTGVSRYVKVSPTGRVKIDNNP